MNLMRYLLEANLYLGVCYMLYLFLFRKETHYQLSRVYLLAASALSFIIPFLKLGVLIPQPETFATLSVMPASITYNDIPTLPFTPAAAPTVAVAPVFTVYDYCLLAYGIITLLLAVNLGIKIFKLISLSKRNTTRLNDDFVLVEIESENAAFSFFSYLFIDAKLAASATIIKHEQVHIRQKHSWDIIYLELIKVFNWFNPFVYFLQNSVKELHEFIADQQTAELENSNDSYANFLISNAYGMRENVLTNSFSKKNMLKRRIIMLYQKRSGRWAKLKYLVALPLLFGLLCLSTMAFTDKDYTYIDIFPHHIKEVVISKLRLRGHSSVADADIASSINNEKDGELNNIEQPEIADPGTANISKRLITAADSTANWKPIIILDGLPFNPAALANFNFKTADEKKYTDLLGIQNSDIKDITIFKGDNAVARYGPTAAGGAIIINTKNKALVVNTNTTEESDSDVVFTQVEVEPVPVMGMDAFYQFLGKNIRYPAADRENKKYGRVIVQFIVEKDGSLNDIKILRKPSDAMAEETIRVLKLAAKWTPGVQNGKIVRVQYTIPVVFSLDEPTATAGKLMTGSSSAPRAFTDFNKYFSDNFRRNNAVKLNTNKGLLIVKYTIENNRIGTVTVSQSLSPELDQLAVNVIKSYPNNIVVKDGTYDVIFLNAMGELKPDDKIKINEAVKNSTPTLMMVSKNYSGTTAATSTASAIDSVFKKVDVYPMPPGGNDEFYRFLGNHIKYPVADKMGGIQGRVVIGFVVEKDGSLSNINVMRSPSATLAEEAIRVLELSPNWTPGQQNGKTVRVKFTVPVNFSLGKDDKSYLLTLPNSDGLYKELAYTIKYPKEAKEKNNVGRMLVTFNLDDNKQIRDVKILRGFSKVFDDEVIKKVQNCKELLDGKTGSTYLLPVFFALEDADGKYVGTTQRDKDYIDNVKPVTTRFIPLNQVTILGYVNKL